MNHEQLDPRTHLFTGDCVEVLKTFAANSIDSIVCDPPYGLEFMGKEWDKLDTRQPFRGEVQALRVLKPGGHLVAFGGSRTYHRLASALVRTCPRSSKTSRERKTRRARTTHAIAAVRLGRITTRR